MLLLQDISSSLATLEEKADSSQQDSPMPGPSMAPSLTVVPYTSSPAVDLAVPFMSTAHQA